MTALAKARNTRERIGDVLEFPVKAAINCIQGGLAVVNAGYAAPGTTALNLVAIGRFENDYDNTLGADGDIVAEVKQGDFHFVNLPADLILAADVGNDCFIVDDQTVAKTDATSTRSRAGKITKLDADGVWVRLGIAN